MLCSYIGYCHRLSLSSFSPFFFFNHTPTTEIYPLSLHDALPIYGARTRRSDHLAGRTASSFSSDGSVTIIVSPGASVNGPLRDRKSTRLNSSHVSISYAVFCLKKKKKK